MEFLIFTLLGSLMVLPYLSLGLTVTKNMPEYSKIGSEIEISCTFIDADPQLYQMSLLYPGGKSIAFYDLDNKMFQLRQNTRGVGLTVGDGTTYKAGTLNFVFSSLTCNDFTSYVCQGTNPDGAADSLNTSLQVIPETPHIRITTAVELGVHEVAYFECSGRIKKDGQFHIKWYRNSVTPSNLLDAPDAEVQSEDVCSRTVKSILTYNVTEADRPTLVLHCQVNDGRQDIVAKWNQTIPESLTTPAPVAEASTASMDAGSIVGIVLGIIATIVLIVLLVWFLVVRPKRLNADGAAKEKGPEPNAKDYQVQDNVLYATVDRSKIQNHKSSNSSLVDGPDTNSNSVQDTGTAARMLKSNKQNAFLPSRGDATDNMDEAYELPPPPPPPPPKPHRSPRLDGSNPLHYAELELAVHKSAKRRSEYGGPRPNTDYAVITHS